MIESIELRNFATLYMFQECTNPLVECISFFLNDKNDKMTESSPDFVEISIGHNRS